jgi:hypothetical protein
MKNGINIFLIFIFGVQNLNANGGRIYKDSLEHQSSYYKQLPDQETQFHYQNVNSYAQTVGQHIDYKQAVHDGTFTKEEISEYLIQLEKILFEQKKFVGSYESQFSYQVGEKMIEATISPAVEAQIEALILSIGNAGIKKMLQNMDCDHCHLSQKEKSILDKAKLIFREYTSEWRHHIHLAKSFVRDLLANPQKYFLSLAGNYGAYYANKVGVILTLVFMTTIIPYTIATEGIEAMVLGPFHIFCHLFQVIYAYAFAKLVSFIQLPIDLMRQGSLGDLHKRIFYYFKGKMDLKEILKRAFYISDQNKVNILSAPKNTRFLGIQTSVNNNPIWFFLHDQLAQLNLQTQFDLQNFFSSDELSSDQRALELLQWVSLMRQIETLLIFLGQEKNRGDQKFNFQENHRYWASLGSISREISKWERSIQVYTGASTSIYTLDSETIENFAESKNLILEQLFKVHQFLQASINGASDPNLYKSVRLGLKKSDSYLKLGWLMDCHSALSGYR